jgi:Asp/Glu/hydantoin racemase
MHTNPEIRRPEYRRLGLIHTTASLVPVFQDLCRELLPKIETFNIADDSLVKDVIAHGGLTPGVSNRLGSHIQCAELAGAEVILVTCSSVGPAVEASQPFVSVPVLRVDQPMVDRAISIAERIGVVATLSTTLGPTAELIGRRALSLGRPVEVIARLCTGAFEAFLAGDTGLHDRMIQQQLEELRGSVDAIVLAQASMSRVIPQLTESLVSVPILTSPRLAIESVAELLNLGANSR